MSRRRRLLLISSSVVHGSGYLDHAADEIADVLGSARRVAFVPFALLDRDGHARKARERLARMGREVVSIHDQPDARLAIEAAEALFVGGGNTFRLLAELQRADLIGLIRDKVARGMPYIGSSAGSIVACPTLKTTKDMPIVEPTSFEALALVEFQISPHYLDPDPATTHMGETQQERILQYLEENDRPVAGLREGAMLRVEAGAVTLKGVAGARVFRRSAQPLEATPVADLSSLLGGRPVP
jgi:dipeptidase E